MAALATMVRPELPTPFPRVPELWTCPITGLVVPKDPVKNLAWRANLLQQAEDDPGLQADLFTASSMSILFWVNAFAFTLRIQETDTSGKRRQAEHTHLPFVTWEIQDRHLIEIQTAIDTGYDLLTDKTRDMGASWDHIIAFHHQWLFRQDRLFLEMSRVESDVDGADNPRCLFAKHEYINRWLPEWMLPEIDRTNMHLVNLTRNNRIDGESSNKAAGSSARVHAILMDEFAKMENAEKIKSSTADVSSCRLVNSTPWGAGTTYSKWRMSGQIKVFVLPWYEHPEKGLNRYVKQDDTTGKWKIRSPWYDEECTKRTPKEMAQEIDMDHIGSGDTFFEAHTVEEHKRLFGRMPHSTRTIDFKKTVTNAEIPGILLRNQRDFLETHGGRGPLRIWTHLIGGRFDQTKNYVIGCDISKGQGASNSVLSIICKETGEKVAEWADANTPPYELARIACAIGIWVGGSNGGRALLIWEANGPGWDFGREVVHTYQYPSYWRDKNIGTTVEKAGDKYGWHSNNDKKEVVLGHYAKCLVHGGVVNHSVEALDEAMLYIRYPEGGGIGPAVLMEESDSARKTHGDRVIADMLALWALGDAPRAKLAGPVAPKRSFAARMRAHKKAMKDRKEGKTFDFRLGGN